MIKTMLVIANRLSFIVLVPCTEEWCERGVIRAVDCLTLECASTVVQKKYARLPHSNECTSRLDRIVTRLKPRAAAVNEPPNWIINRH